MKTFTDKKTKQKKHVKMILASWRGYLKLSEEVELIALRLLLF